MHILDEIRVDSSGRIGIAKLFDKVPGEVLVIFDDIEKALFFMASNGEWPSTQRKVDSKNRVVLPKRIREKTGDEFYLIPESKEKHCLLAKKYFE